MLLEGTGDTNACVAPQETSLLPRCRGCAPDRVDPVVVHAWTIRRGTHRRSHAARDRPPGLTRREIEIARLLASRRRTSEIAELLGVSVHTARRHTEHVLMKLGVHSRREVERVLIN
jgi:DNA-binding CsgD family transcriptional regulator